MTRKIVNIEKFPGRGDNYQVAITSNYSEKSSHWNVVFVSEDVSECRIIAKAYIQVGYRAFEKDEEILLDNSTECGRID